MGNKIENAEVPEVEVKLLSGRAHEYVVNFRNRFLTYFALPLFLLFIALALAISWVVFVPARSEHIITIQNEAGRVPSIKLSDDTERFILLNVDQIETAYLSYAFEDGSSGQIDCEVTDNGEVRIKEVPVEWKNDQQTRTTTLVLFTREDRFLFKLLDELAKNLKVKKPTCTQ